MNNSLSITIGLFQCRKNISKGNRRGLKSGLDDLTGLGFLGFDDFLDNKDVLAAWQDGGSMGVSKSNSRIRKAQSVGFLGRKHRNQRIANHGAGGQALNERGVPKRHRVLRLHRGMPPRRDWRRPGARGPPYPLRSALRESGHLNACRCFKILDHVVCAACETASQPRKFDAPLRHRIFSNHDQTPSCRATCRLAGQRS